MELRSTDDFEALRTIVPVSRETHAQLVRFTALVERWSKGVNLVSASTLPDLWTRHVLDSAQLYALNPGPCRWIDLGSGGGFPGVVLAVLLDGANGGHVDLVESSARKGAFLRRALVETGARGRVHVMRVEAAAKVLTGHEAVSARAFAGLDTLLGLAWPWIAAGATGYFHKGRNYRRELDRARSRWAFDLLEHPSRIGDGSVILRVSNLKRLPQQPLHDRQSHAG